MVRISGFGQDGPYATRAGYAAIGEAMGGLRALTGYPDRPPTRVGVSIGDSLTGMFGALAALEARHRTGRGQIVDASIYESVLAVTEALVTDWHAEGLARERTGPTLPGIAPSNVYTTNDGQVLIAANQDSVFARLVTVMGQPELAADPRFASHQARAGHVADIDAVVTAWTLTRSSAEVLARLHEAGVPAGRSTSPGTCSTTRTSRPGLAGPGGRREVRRDRHAGRLPAPVADTRPGAAGRSAAGRGHRRRAAGTARPRARRDLSAPQ